MSELSPATNGKNSEDKSAERAEKLYKEVKTLYEETGAVSREKAWLMLEKIEDAIKEFGNTNQEKKVELRNYQGPTRRYFTSRNC